jgi:hypothetical protein
MSAVPTWARRGRNVVNRRGVTGTITRVTSDKTTACVKNDDTGKDVAFDGGAIADFWRPARHGKADLVRLLAAAQEVTEMLPSNTYDGATAEQCDLLHRLREAVAAFGHNPVPREWKR